MKTTWVLENAGSGAENWWMVSQVAGRRQITSRPGTLLAALARIRAELERRRLDDPAGAKVACQQWELMRQDTDNMLRAKDRLGKVVVAWHDDGSLTFEGWTRVDQAQPPKPEGGAG